MVNLQHYPMNGLLLKQLIALYYHFCIHIDLDIHS